ncbi:MAG: glycosyltransferase, partial [Calditrichaeota bacterium]|nr:glycosyltransferase [Calditrichota bacterium]
MKILCTGPELIIPGGVTSYLRTLQPHLGDMLDYFIVGARGQQEGLLNKIYRMFKDYWGFSRTLCRRDYDLIHLNPSFGTKALLRDGIFLLISKMLRKKVVIFIHGWDESCEYRIRKRWLWLFRCVYFHANAFIVLAEEFKSKLRSFGYMKPIYRGTTCVDDAVFTVFTEKSYDLYKPDAPFNVLFLSRLEKEKGVFETIEAFAIIKDKYPYITLTIAGDGDALESARDFTVQRGLEEISF